MGHDSSALRCAGRAGGDAIGGSRHTARPRGAWRASRAMLRGRRRSRPVSLTVLSVGFPYAPVGPCGVGGAEHILSVLDHALVANGHRSLVAACEGSETAGDLFSVAL